ncbi:MAG TPA: DUF6796 family protein [Rhodanobacteraceae bacterium]|jgi:hypothetical protein|nr:DUF6796 family protein [Rhodanobacteraceae bacterium]
MATHERIRIAGLLGLAGALLLAVGDQCLYFAAISGADFMHGLLGIVAAAPTGRVLFGASLGPVAALLYLAGFWHVYVRLRTRHPRIAALIAIGLALCLLAGTAYHVLWGAKALAMKATLGAAATDQPVLAALEAQLRAYAANVYLIAEIAGYPSAVLLAIMIATGRSDYPRWLALLTPAIPLVILQFVAPYTPAPFGSLVAGSASNLSFALFFAASLATLRKPMPSGVSYAGS